jgi:hypothetical protein
MTSKTHAALTALLAAAALGLGLGVVACIDLFHSTSDVLTACELDANTPGCGVEASMEAGTEAGTSFCSWSASTARTNAEHACAWLGACETPLGRNAYGACMFEALLAYDCAANPAHPVKGEAHALWDCLWQAQTCAAVTSCVFPQGPQPCAPGDFVACASPTGQAPNATVRAECVDGGIAHGENCALWGQTCGGDLAIGVCAASSGEAGIACTSSRCDQGVLHWCAPDGGDVGIDCASNGAQQCNGYPSPTAAQWLACVPLTDGGSCTPDASASCAGGVATSCPAGQVETIDCAALLGSASACVPGELSPRFDWTSPCSLATTPAEDAGEDDAQAEDAATGDAGTDGATACIESCSGTHLVACYRGAAFTLDCAQVGLGACTMVTTDEGTTVHPACAPP